MPELFKFAYRHSCGSFAFRYSYKPGIMDSVHSNCAQHLDGSPIEEGSIITCDSCGESLSEVPLSKDVVKWT